MKRQIVSVSLLLLVSSLAAADVGKAVARPVSGSSRLPDEVVYWHLFRHVAALAQQADALEKRGEDGSKLRSLYQTQARLSDEQARALHDTALDCTRQVAAQDRKALEVIRAARAQAGKGGRLRGGTPPPPPPELAALQQERNAFVLSAREKLQRELGEQEFQRFHAFVEEHVARQIRSLEPAGKLPVAAQRGAER